MTSYAQQEISRRRQMVKVINLAWDEAAHPRAEAGSAAGGQFVAAGAARNSEAQKAQDDKGAKELYEQAMKSGDFAKFMAGLKDSDLQKVTRYLYSFKSSDKKVVAGRIAAANQISKRGGKVTDYGALGSGGGSTKKKKSTTKVTSTKKAPAPAPASRSYTSATMGTSSSARSGHGG